MPDFTYDVGRVSFIMKGAWNLATNYEKLDAVSYNGSLYIAKQDVPGGTAITNTTYWQLAAEKGDKGDTGGVDSVNGQQGDVWFPDSRQLISDGYTTDTDPFLMKGNDSDSDRFELAKKLGNTVGVNDFVANANKSFTGGTTGQMTKVLGSFYLVSGRTYLAHCMQKTTYTSIERNTFFVRSTDSSFTSIYESGQVNYKMQAGARFWMFTSNATGPAEIAFWTVNADVAGEYENVGFHDVTIWYGSPDRIPSDLLSHPENWGRYYAGSLAYNAGTLESADGTVMRSIGRNLWDEEWELGGLSETTGNGWSASDRIRSKNFIPVIPNGDIFMKSSASFGVVCFYDANQAFVAGYTSWSRDTARTVPANAYFMKFQPLSSYGATYKNDITISLYYSGESGYDQYYPYSVLAEVDTGSEVLRSAGAVADEKTPDGTITRRIGYVDMGTLTWTYNTTEYAYGYFQAVVADKAMGFNFATARYVNSGTSRSALQDKQIGLRNSSSSYNYICVRDDSITSLNAFLSAMSGVYLVYELSTPATEQGTAFAPIVATVKNGVLSWTNTKGIPVGQESHWFENLRKRVEDRLPDPPSGDGTYRLTCTITGGVKVYSWEA